MFSGGVLCRGAGTVRCHAILVLRPAATTPSTASVKPSVAPSSASPSSSDAAISARKGCRSCTWLTRSTPPSARPRYQAKKPSHMENTAV